MNKRNDLTACEARELLDYNPDTGRFIWRANVSIGTRVGSAAGTLRGDGYVTIRLHGSGYRAHRLAWLLTYGEWPKYDIDHINRIRNDNRICNLRQVTRSQNNQNASIYKNNTLGIRGVRVAGACIYAEITTRGRKKYLGNFPTIDSAASAYAAAKKMLHPFAAEYAK